jgi:hypothetical protein
MINAQEGVAMGPKPWSGEKANELPVETLSPGIHNRSARPERSKYWILKANPLIPDALPERQSAP